MQLRKAVTPLLPMVASVLLAAMLAGCSMGSGLSLTTSKVEGYDISEDALAQIRPGQSQDLVVAVLGSPQSVNSFGSETAWYYIETKIDQTAFGMKSVKSRTVLAIYFGKDKRVADKAVYSAKDGRVITVESRKTPSYGVDRSFIESILASVGL